MSHFPNFPPREAPFSPRTRLRSFARSFACVHLGRVSSTGSAMSPTANIVAQACDTVFAATNRNEAERNNLGLRILSTLVYREERKGRKHRFVGVKPFDSTYSNLFQFRESCITRLVESTNYNLTQPHFNPQLRCGFSEPSAVGFRRVTRLETPHGVQVHCA